MISGRRKIFHQNRRKAKKSAGDTWEKGDNVMSDMFGFGVCV